jgi:hypothetical protein
MKFFGSKSAQNQKSQQKIYLSVDFDEKNQTKISKPLLDIILGKQAKIG